MAHGPRERGRWGEAAERDGWPGRDFDFSRRACHKHRSTFIFRRLFPSFSIYFPFMLYLRLWFSNMADGSMDMVVNLSGGSVVRWLGGHPFPWPLCRQPPKQTADRQSKCAPRINPLMDLIEWAEGWASTIEWCGENFGKVARERQKFDMELLIYLNFFFWNLYILFSNKITKFIELQCHPFWSSFSPPRVKSQLDFVFLSKRGFD